MLPGVSQQRIDTLLKTELQFNPDYYRIVDLHKLSIMADEGQFGNLLELIDMERRST